MPEMTPQKLRKMADITADCMRYFLSGRAVATSDNTRTVMQQRADTLRSVAFILRQIVAKEFVPVVHCDECIYGNDCKRYVNIVADADSVRPVTFCSAGKRKP